MATLFALHGGCQCGRNYYVVQPPPGAPEVARVLFDSLGQTHYTPTPVSAHLRIPLSWYHSGTTAFFDDETPAMIHRVYEQPNPRDQATFTQRRFCGFCGTPLSFWSESPRHEADFIRLAVGSLHAQDLNRLDDWGAIGEEGDDNDDDEEEETAASEGVNDESAERQRTGPRGSRDGTSSPALSVTSSSSTGLPWLDRFLAGSLLDRHLLHQRQRESSLGHRHRLAQRTGGRSVGPSGPSAVSALSALSAAPADAHIRRHDKVSATSADGSMHVEWEVMEWTEGDDDGERNSGRSSGDSDRGQVRDLGSPAKRQKQAGNDAMDTETSDGRH